MKCDLSRLLEALQTARRLDILTDEQLLDTIRWAKTCPDIERTTAKASDRCGIALEIMDALVTLVHSLHAQPHAVAPSGSSGEGTAALAGDLLHGASPDAVRLSIDQATQAVSGGAQAPSTAARVECSQTASLNVPRRLGPYVMGEELGHGAMGSVYLGRHASLGTEFAVKIMRLDLDKEDSRDRVARFHQEAAAVARMGKHANIVTIHDFGQESDLLWYSMERVKGKSLQEVLRDRHLNPEEAAEVLELVARSIHFAHEHGVIHRDIKPSNILIREADGQPQIADFGLARDLSRHEAGSDLGTALARSLKEFERTAEGAFMGTPAYMAPEQARGDTGAIDARTDVYALGAVLYEILAGRPPHSGQGPGGIIAQILRGDIIPPSQVVEERRDGSDLCGVGMKPLPIRDSNDAGTNPLDESRLRGAHTREFRDIQEVCMKALALDPGKRYPSAAVLADDLARFRRGEPLACQGFNPEGKRLGSYQLHELVGQGGLSKVYRAIHVELGTTVAVKVSKIGDAEAAARHVREAKLHAKVRHAHLAPIHDVGQVGDLVYYAMDFVPGKSTQALLKERKLTAVEAATIVEKIAAAVQCLHDRGIIHRNLKPGKVLIDQKTGEPFLLESGLSLDLKPDLVFDSERSEYRDQGGEVVGTPIYMAPEQARGETNKIGIRTDVYGLGAILYELLSSRPVRAEKDLGSLLDAIARGDTIERPRRVRKDVPRGLEAICMRALATRPEDRYASAAMLAEDIERWREGMPLRATVGNRIGTRWDHGVWLGVLVVAILMFVGTAGDIWERVHDNEPRAYSWALPTILIVVSFCLACLAAVLAHRRGRLREQCLPRGSDKTS